MKMRNVSLPPSHRTSPPPPPTPLFSISPFLLVSQSVMDLLLPFRCQLMFFIPTEAYTSKKCLWLNSMSSSLSMTQRLSPPLPPSSPVTLLGTFYLHPRLLGSSPPFHFHPSFFTYCFCYNPPISSPQTLRQQTVIRCRCAHISVRVLGALCCHGDATHTSLWPPPQKIH